MIKRNISKSVNMACPRIMLLTDYKGFYGSKQLSRIYRGGMDITKLISLFNEYGYFADAINISRLNIKKLNENPSVILYTSSEDKYGKYKSYIEDIIFNLEKLGHFVIPSFEYLRSHNNKVAMELLRDRSELPKIKTIKSQVFGSFEEISSSINNFSYPIILKTASGSMSKGVLKAENHKQLLIQAKRVSKSRNIPHDTKEILRKIKYRDRYHRESFFRSSFVLQNMIANLTNDWKILIYGNKGYALLRENRKNDFRASGSGIFQFSSKLPPGILDFAFSIKEFFNVPHISLDIGYDGSTFHLIEFQFLYFGTTTLEKSPHYYLRKNKDWILVGERSDIEKTYVESIVDFIEKQIISA